MAEEDSLFLPPPPTDVSVRALAIGRTIDRLCRAPGTYALMVVVPSHRRSNWQVKLYRVEALQTLEIGRR
jgi:hypothetical protein